MVTETTVSSDTTIDIRLFRYKLRRQTVWTYAVALALFLIAVVMRFYTLYQPFERDYDEGVYWQTLRAMSAGHALYQQVFYSQPPFFMWSIFPIYMLGGQTIGAARAGIALLSLGGLVGAFALGKVLRGNVGGIAALLLAVVAPIYLSESQVLQGDAPSTALSLLAVGMAYLWWKHSDGRAGLCYALLTTIALALSIQSKLLTISACVPIGLLALAHLRRISQMPRAARFAAARSLLAGGVTFVLVSILLLLPFAGTFAAFWDQVVSFHTAASTALHATQAANTAMILQSLNTPLSYVALYTTIVALWKRDWHILPLIAWFLATVLFLWRQTPLFPHHLVALIPPLIGLAIMGLAPITLDRPDFRSIRTIVAIVAALLILATATINVGQDWSHYTAIHALDTASSTQDELQITSDLQRAIQPGQFVITDAQFLAALAERNTPPALVDTSNVHIESGYLNSSQLIQAAQQPQVQVVFFYSGRLAAVSAFHTWVSQHFRLLHDYGGGRQMWVKAM